MNFDFSDDEKRLKEEAHGFLNDRCPPKAVRRVLEGELPFDRDLWRGVAELGWTGAAIPEAYGGVGLGHVGLCALAEELGAALAPIPFASSIYLAAEALLLAGTEAQKSRWLPKLATGQLIGTIAVAEGAEARSGKPLATSAEGGRLSGTKLPVADGAYADIAIVAARTAKSPLALYVVELNQPEIDRAPVKTIDPSRGHARLTFRGAKAEPLGSEADGEAILKRLYDRAAILVGFEQVGGASVALDMACNYARERYAFGRPIGSQQAVKHKLADVYCAVELARSNAYWGAWALGADAPELPLAAATARVAGSRAFYVASKENIQVHGGMGFTWEGDCHLYYRRAKHLALMLGAAPEWKEKLVNEIERRNAA
ncbi:acyl-CoA dehydrogenase family protein [Desertibaculum subflavum]|uniref:acyl-CoA dehydrogenase family protein n=1 Tax=Desertibaculum subflavum TaxID=2268458 RepID=UPI000E6690ED